VEEFFQLFKTPWEIYRPGGMYSVVIATTSAVPEVRAKLLLVYGADVNSVDSRAGVVAGRHLHSAWVSHRDTLLPIYGAVQTFSASPGVPCVTAGPEIVGVKVGGSGSTVIRLGYDLFDEIGLLLSKSQPLEQAHVPTLDAHINMLRTWILEERIPLLEIPPSPAGHSFAVCLTHDIDFIGIRNHKFDHTMFGFLYRSTVGALRNLLRGRLSVRRLWQTWRAVASLPLVYLSWAKDFWDPFQWYLKAEENLPATYFLIPFKHRSGDHVPGRHASRRAAAYDVSDIKEWALIVAKAGCELGVHGLDAWHSVEKGRSELARIGEVSEQSSFGIRMHWLLQNSKTSAVLEKSGFAYDSTAGYNETIGYANGTTQVFRPRGARTLLELPLHIQDGALFYPQRLDLSEPQAQERCQPLINHALKHGGVLTLLWHDRSHGPERFWGDFYLGLLRELRSLDAWFGTAAQVVGWFRNRREVRFERVETHDGIRARLQYHGGEVQPPFKIRIYRPVGNNTSERLPDFVDTPWNGESLEELETLIPVPSAVAAW